MLPPTRYRRIPDPLAYPVGATPRERLEMLLVVDNPKALKKYNTWFVPEPWEKDALPRNRLKPSEKKAGEWNLLPQVMTNHGKRCMCPLCVLSSNFSPDTQQRAALVASLVAGKCPHLAGPYRFNDGPSPSSSSPPPNSSSSSTTATSFEGTATTRSELIQHDNSLSRTSLHQSGHRVEQQETLEIKEVVNLDTGATTNLQTRVRRVQESTWQLQSEEVKHQVSLLVQRTQMWSKEKRQATLAAMQRPSSQESFQLLAALRQRAIDALKQPKLTLEQEEALRAEERNKRAQLSVREWQEYQWLQYEKQSNTPLEAELDEIDRQYRAALEAIDSRQLTELCQEDPNNKLALALQKELGTAEQATPLSCAAGVLEYHSIPQPLTAGAIGFVPPEHFSSDGTYVHDSINLHPKHLPPIFTPRDYARCANGTDGLTWNAARHAFNRAFNQARQSPMVTAGKDATTLVDSFLNCLVDRLSKAQSHGAGIAGGHEVLLYLWETTVRVRQSCAAFFDDVSYEPTTRTVTVITPPCNLVARLDGAVCGWDRVQGLETLAAILRAHADVNKESARRVVLLPPSATLKRKERGEKKTVPLSVD